MRRISLLLTALTLWTGQKIAAQEPPKCPLGDGWTFVPEFSDEFNGDSLDPEKWWDFNPTTFIGRKPGLFSRENVAVKDGSLQLTASRMPPAMVTVENAARGYHTFATAIVKSKRRVQYGYFEVRCKAMKSGATSAFWFYDPLDPDKKYVPGYHSEEIDVFEIFGKHPRLAHTCFMTIHRQDTPYVETLVRINLKSTGSQWIAPHNFADDFHLFALLWTNEEMKWYVDGIERWSIKNEFHKNPLHMMFDSEIMQAWGGLPELSDLPSVFYVDYVRAWQKFPGIGKRGLRAARAR
jgi:beta-glucanase (GH16 family)